jgi:hypothetical protein
MGLMMIDELCKADALLARLTGSMYALKTLADWSGPSRTSEAGAECAAEGAVRLLNIHAALLSTAIRWTLALSIGQAPLHWCVRG